MVFNGSLTKNLIKSMSILNQTFAAHLTKNELKRYHTLPNGVEWHRKVLSDFKFCVYDDRFACKMS